MVRRPANESPRPERIDVMEGEIMEALVTPLGLLFPPLWCTFYFFLIIFFNCCIAQESKLSLYGIAFDLPFKMRCFSLSLGLGHAMVPFMMYGSNMVLKNWVMAIMGEVELMSGLFLLANVYVPTIFCILMFF